MLQLSGMFINKPILSLRVGRAIATTLGPVLNPNNLKIEGFYCQTPNRKQYILLSQDVRDVMPQGVVVNDEDALTDPEELVRLDKLIQLNFDVMGKIVVTTGGHKMGKVSDYAIETEGLFIQKLYVTQSLFKNFNGGNVGVDRTQITEITDKAIVINDPQQKVPVTARAVA
jgi:sporulation protein YlmC with PRC-barrel domain